MTSFIKICDKEIRVRGRLLRIGSLEGEKYVFLEQPERIVEELRKGGRGIDLFTFIQRLPEIKPKYAYPMEWDNFAALPVSSFDHWWSEQIGKKTRNKVRLAEKKGIVVREVPFDETLVKGIVKVYNESPVRQGNRNAHYGKNFEAIYRAEATFLDSSVFIGAYLDDSLIGFIKLVHDETRTQAGLMNIVSMIRHRDKSPTNALVAQAVRSCAERKIPYLVYSNFAYGKKAEGSLMDFKERNGFTRIDVPRYYIPLTQIGRLAYRIGLHRRITEYLPASTSARMRDIRAAWYNRKLPQVSDAF